MGRSLRFLKSGTRSERHTAKPRRDFLGGLGHHNRRLILEELEDRRLLSVAPPTVLPLNVVLISDAVAQAPQIRAAAAMDTIPIVYHSDMMTTIGLDNLLATVSAAHNGALIGHLGIVAHGSPGEVDLGKGDDLSLATLPSQAAALGRLRSVFTSDARLDLYSCSVAAGACGKTFVDELAADTGAAVFASDNPVGTVAGSDFTWDYHTGNAVANSELLSVQEMETIPRLCLASTIIFYSGDRVEAKSSAGANIRATPGGTLLYNEPEFETGTVLSTTPQYYSSGGAGYWYQIKWDDDTTSTYVGDWTGDSVLGLAFGYDNNANAVGAFNGVTAYSNGSNDWGSDYDNYSTGVNTGMEWQCVEYVNRYYYSKYQINLAGAGNAVNYYSYGSANGLTPYLNGNTTVAPQAGDILCFSGGPEGYGHVAIVCGCNGSNEVDVIEQNGTEDRRDADFPLTMTVSGGVYNVSAANLSGSLSVQGWLRKSAALPAPTLSSPSNSATGVSTSPTFSWSQVSGNLGYRIIVSTNLSDLPTDPNQQGGTPSNGFNTTVGQNTTSDPYTGTLEPAPRTTGKCMRWGARGAAPARASIASRPWRRCCRPRR